MARYKYIDTNPKFLAVDLAKQLVPGTFEHAVDHLLEHAIDLTRFDARFRNDVTGAPAYPPAMLLKVVLVAYARGMISSRAIEAACREHVTFIALCGDTAPHFTTIAHFVSTVGDDIAHVFAAVVAICDQQGLISHEMFAIDGVKLPSNASKQRSGTRADFEQQATKLEASVTTMVERHRATDALPVEPTLAFKAAKRIRRLERDATQVREWLAAHPEIDALIADNEMRRRDERFATQDRHKAAPDPLHDKSPSQPEPASTLFPPSDFTYDAEARTCICPAGKRLNRNGHRRVIRDNIWERFVGKKQDCGACPLRAQCIRAPETTAVRAVMFFQGKTAPLPETHTARMKRRIDSPEGRRLYGRRVGSAALGVPRYLNALNRRMRTRMSGGVGGLGREISPPYPDRLSASAHVRLQAPRFVVTVARAGDQLGTVGLHVQR